MKFNLKKVIASVAALAMSLSCFTAFAADFSDVEATASYKNAIDTLVALDVVNGYEDGTFKPEAEITRAEVTKMVVAAMGPSYTAAAESSVGSSEFTDVTGHWAAGYISVGVAQKFINGMGDGTFAPDANVTYAQIVKMLVAALGYESAASIAGGYPNGYLQVGNQIGVTAGVAGVAADTNVTRAQVAQLIANALDIPLVVVTNWTTNILTGEPVAETKIMDGEEGRSYKTLLTEYHDTYKVKGRVEATHAQGFTKVGEVDFRVENADNYDGYAYKAYTKMEDIDGDTIPEKVYYNSAYVSGAKVGDTNAEDLLFTYAEALIKIDADDEATLLTITPYGKNDIFTLAAKDFAAFTGGTPDTLDFYMNETSSKTKTYKLDAAVELYVNGVYVGGVNAGSMATYATANKIGTVTLIDSPATGETSKDGDIDFVMIDVAKWAMVEAAVQEGDNLVIYLKDFETGFVDTPITLDTTNEDIVYTFTKNGAEVEFETIKENDILLVKYDLINKSKATDSNFVSIDICDNVVEGVVTAIKSDDGVPVYTIAGNDYKSIDGALTVTDEYRVFLDSANRIVKKEKLATSANYGIVDRVYKDGNSDEFKIRIIKADGTREAFVAKDQATAEDAAFIAYAAADNDGTLESNEYDHSGSTATLDATLKNRVVQYKTNSSNEVNSIVLASNINEITSDTEYTETTKKVGSARMSDATQILDLTKYIAGGMTAAADIKAGSLASFVDGEKYQVIYADKNNSDNTYGFVIITAGNQSITAGTSFIVVNNVASGTGADGASVDVINAYTADATDMVELVVDEDATGTAANTLVNGDVVVVAIDANGIVTEISPVMYTVGDSASTIWGKTPVSDPMGGTNKYFQSNVGNWDTTGLTDNNWSRIGFGIVTDKIGNTLYVARRDAVDTDPTDGPFDDDADGVYDEPGETTPVDAVAEDSDIAALVGTGSSYKIQTGAIITRENEIDALSVSTDVNVFVYDYNKRADVRISKGAYGSIAKTFVPETSIVANGGEDIIDWTAFDLSGKTPNYVFYKVTNDEITDIVFVKPAV